MSSSEREGFLFRLQRQRNRTTTIELSNPEIHIIQNVGILVYSHYTKICYILKKNKYLQYLYCKLHT